MNRSLNLAFLLSLSCFITSTFIIVWSTAVQTSHSLTFEAEKNSTLSNSSLTSFDNEPITTIIIPNESSKVNVNSASSNNVTNVTMQSVPSLNSLSISDTNGGETGNQTQSSSLNDGLNANVTTKSTNNATVSDSQQRGEYLTDNNGLHYYNINNCSEKKGSSGIGDMSECEDAAKEISEG